MAAELGEAFVPIRATLDKLDGDLAAARSKISDALGGLGDGLQKAGGLALAGVVGAATAALGGLTAALGFSISEALSAEQSQSTLALAMKNANEVIAAQGDAWTAASGQTVTSTKLSADALSKLQDELTHATAKLDDMEAAYPKLKNPTESQTLALEDQRKKVEQLSAALAEGSAVITTKLVDALNLVPPAAGFTMESLNALAQANMNLAGGSDDVIMAIETIALRSGNISSTELPAFIQRTLDLGQVMGDTAGAATLLARADEDPIGAMGRLTKAGVVFAPVLKKQIQDMVKAGDTAGAVALLYDRVSEATGGAAAAHAATLAGQWEILKGNLGEAAETVGTALLPMLHNLNEGALQPLIPIVTSIAAELAAWIGDGNLEHLDNVLSLVASAFELFGFDGKQVESVLFAISDGVQSAGTFITGTLLPALAVLVEQVKPFIEQAAQWVAQNVKLQDVLITLGVAIAAVIIPALVSFIAAAAPVVLAVLAVLAVVVLLRQAWETDFGGIQEKTAAVWAVVQPLLAQAVQWLSVNLPIAIEALRAWWVDVAWPAIQNAIAVAWPIIQQIFQALVDFTTGVIIPTIANLWTFWTTVWWPGIIAALSAAWAFMQPILAAIVQFVVGTLIPTVLNLWSQWVNVWWPAISNALTNAWTVIVAVFNELDRWVNKNIVPWINFLKKTWSEEVWPAISKALNDAWLVIEPIWTSLAKWLNETLPPAITGLQTIFSTAMGGISSAVSPVKELWDKFTSAVQSFWNWISSNTFTFKISLPDLPDWAVPGSPLPIHTAWKNFASDMGRTVIKPQFNLDAMVPAAGIVGQDGGSERAIHFSSTTTVNTNRDPLRVLRASRHLDKLGSMV